MAELYEWFKGAVRVIVPTCLAIVLISVWLATERHEGRPYFQHLFILFVLLGIIFFADGIEVAYSVLRYKDPEQFSGIEARLLAEMRRNENLVYEAREWLVTIIIVVITIMAEYDEIWNPWTQTRFVGSFYIPYVLTITSKTLFSLLFTTLPVLWFAQGLSKRIARDCPQKFIGAGAIVWSLVKKVGWFTESLGLDAPTAVLTKSLKRSDSFSAESGMKPSDHAYFVGSLQRYGYALHELYTRIKISSSGACEANVRVLYYGVSNPANVFGRRLIFDAPPAAANHYSVDTTEIYTGPAIQEADPGGVGHKALQAELDFLCSGGLRGKLGGKALFKKIPGNISVTAVHDQKVSNLMHYRIDAHGSIPKSAEAFAILVEFRTIWDANAFKTTPHDEDEFYMAFESPCYRYRLSIEMDASCSGQLTEVQPEALCANDPHWGERDRLQRALIFDSTAPKGLACELYFPFPGIRYKFKWKVG